MDLEMADYERTVQALNQQLTERDKTTVDLQTEVQRQEDRVKSLQEQLGE